ncbi:hypothetical protein L226DRAFT_568118 [Lentinus tigrinus ALCF2SS1-7]|uniref:uncharacterized protein n=1 Tax=Lentinus tigrinus ALCF2SS1-7 TaxID=1328758 RepID=UPI0011660952|nr:hypothetical protein L226DRAFT_568118 [Lentinus tigrinus ALCF2SS1-7]
MSFIVFCQMICEHMQPRRLGKSKITELVDLAIAPVVPSSYPKLTMSIPLRRLPLNPWPSLSFSTLFYMNMSTDVFADAMICVTMSWLLLREKSSMNFRRTNHVIHTLMLYSVSTGALATLCYLGCLISYAVAPNTSIFLAFITSISKRASQSHDSLRAACQTSQMIRGRTLAVFLNSLLASLNSRETIRAQMAFTGILSLPSPGSQWLGMGTGSSDGEGREGLSSGELSA